MSYKEVGNGIVYHHSTLLTTLKLIHIKKGVDNGMSTITIFS